MKISFVVTSYNYEKYIRITLDSLLKQTYKDFDVVIVDDGSNDNSLEIINEYVNKYDNFKLYTHENNVNKGLVDSLKLGITKATGDYIAFLESDDFLSEDYLLEKVNYIKKHPKSNIIINDIKTIENKNKDFYVEEIREYYTNKKKNKE